MKSAAIWTIHTGGKGMWCPWGGEYEKSASGSRAECEEATKAKGFPFYYWITTSGQAEWARCLPINYDIESKLKSDPNTGAEPACVYVEGSDLYSPPDGNRRHDFIFFQSNCEVSNNFTTVSANRRYVYV